MNVERTRSPNGTPVEVEAQRAAERALLPGLPVQAILARYLAGAGDEVRSGKFASPKSSAALVANAFGYFFERPSELPPLPGCEETAWPASRVELEQVVRFPWSGGRHPHLDVIVQSSAVLIGIESKRYEPFRPRKSPSLSTAYWRPVWGESMAGYQGVRDQLGKGTSSFRQLDAAQLVKHAFALRTQVHHKSSPQGQAPVLFYLYAEMGAWPNGELIDAEEHRKHREEIAAFATAVAGDEVRFLSCSYQELLKCWRDNGGPAVRSHAEAFSLAFAV